MKKRPNFVWLNASNVFQPCSTPSNTKYALQANLCGQKAIFSLFGPLFGPLGAIYWKFSVWQMGQTGQPECPQCCSNLFQPVPTRSVVMYGLSCENANFGPCLVLFGPWEGPNMKNARWSSWNRGQYTYWDQKKKTISGDDGVLSLNAYHLYRWYLIVL